MTPLLLVECMFILTARAIDVSLGTFRIMMVVQGRKKSAFLIGFIEMLIWVSVVTSVISKLNSVFHLISYAFGFGLGNYLGITLEKKLSLGEQVLRIFSRRSDLADNLRQRGYYVTEFQGQGKEGPIHLLYLKIKRAKSLAALRMAQTIDPELFYIIENIAQSSRVTAEEVFNDSGWHSFLKK